MLSSIESTFNDMDKNKTPDWYNQASASRADLEASITPDWVEGTKADLLAIQDGTYQDSTSKDKSLFKTVDEEHADRTAQMSDDHKAPEKKRNRWSDIWDFLGTGDSGTEGSSANN